MAITIKDKVVIVTGASSGIGRACALRLGTSGARVAINYYSNRSVAEDVVSCINRSGGKAFSVQADVGDEGQVQGMFEKVRRTLGSPTILVNNAGIQNDASISEMTSDAWDAVLRTNLRGQFLCARELVRTIDLAGTSEGTSIRGHIVFISSVHDRIPWAGRTNYAAAKGGLKLLMRSLALELGPQQVRVNAVAPGAIKTDINRSVWESEEGRQKVREKIPIDRIGEPDDIAAAVCWLLSDESSYIHGHTLYVDGGMSLYPSFQEAE